MIKIYEVRRVDIHDEGDLRRIILPPIELSARQKILGSKDVLTEYYLKRTLAALHANQDPVLALEDLAFQGYRDLALSPQELRELTEASMKRAYAGYTSVVGDIPIQFRNPDLDTVFTPDFADRASKYNLRLQNRDQDTYNDLLKGLNNNLIKPTTLDELLFNPALAPEVHPGRRREYILELAPEKLSEAEVRRVENLPEVKQYILLRELSKPNQVNKELVERKLGELNKPTLVNVR